MNYMKVLIFLALVIAGVVWGMTSGVRRWRKMELQDAVDLYVEKKGYHPKSLSALGQEYETESGGSRPFLREIPSPGDGYCWEYSESEAVVKVAETPEDSSKTVVKICP